MDYHHKTSFFINKKHY